MDRQEAQEEVVATAGQQFRARNGPFSHHELDLKKVYEGKNAAGDAAWVGRYNDATRGGPVCFRVWKTEQTPLRVSYEYEYDHCALESDPPAPPAA